MAVKCFPAGTALRSMAIAAGADIEGGYPRWRHGNRPAAAREKADGGLVKEIWSLHLTA
jgi:hypothetical protein